jgi:uncharacterized membrane protein
MSISFVYPQYLWLLLLIPPTLFLGLVGRKSESRFRLWGGLALRVLILLFLISALAGIQINRKSELLTTVFVLDMSDSIPPEDQARGEEQVRAAIDEMPLGAQAAIVVFGENALVERLASGEKLFNDLSSVPVTTRTDIAGALQLAQALMPAEGGKRLVLLSDGQENMRQAIQQAELAASQDIELLYLPLGEGQSGAEVLVERLDAPTEAREGETIQVKADVQSNAALEAELRLFVDDRLAESRSVSLSPGLNTFVFEVEASSADSQSGASSFKNFRLQVFPAADTRMQNNDASGFTVVHGPPHILLVEGQPGDGENLARALEAAEMQLSKVAPGEIPTSLAGLAGYDAVILVNTPANALPGAVMEALPVYVRELGKGLLMVGGPDSYGAGGYLRTPLEKALPVDMDVKDKEFQSNLALVLAVDKSGSMGRCHCDNPDLNQTYTRAEVGQPKVDIAKEAIMRSSSALGAQDYLGVVTFDSVVRWPQPLSPLVDEFALEQAIGTFAADGSTNLAIGVQAAYEALKDVSARRKHIILMTDGWVRTGELTALVKQMEAEGITLSVVAAGEGSATYLQELAMNGGGTFYPATDIMNVPDIFLKETVKSVGEYIIEEPTFALPSAPSPVFNGLDSTLLPPLRGYNGTTAKSTARQDLISERGDPLLAVWQFGLGRAAAWTSDMRNQWAGEWLTWDGYPRFAAQLVGDLLPPEKVEGLEASMKEQEGQAVIRLKALDRSGQPRNFLDVQATLVDPEMQVTTLTLEQVGAGEYQAVSPANTPGAYLVRLGANDQDQSLGQITLGMVVPYSPEYKTNDADLDLLQGLADSTGGGPLLELAQAFAREGLRFSASVQEIWQPLLLLAVFLLPLDIAIRRLVLSRRDAEHAQAWIGERLPGRRRVSAGQEPRVLGNLFAARDRARHRQAASSESQAKPTGAASGESSNPLPQPAAQAPRPQGPPAPPPPQAGPEGAETDSLARLKEAKKRARR